MVTRARQQMVVVTSTEAAPGVAGDYQRYAGSGPLVEPSLTGADGSGLADRDPWTADVVAVMLDAGYEVDLDYRVGGFTVDAVLRNVVGPRGEPVAVCCRPGRNHLERELLLRRMGWFVVYAFRSEWSGRLARLAIELNNRLQPSQPQGEQ